MGIGMSTPASWIGFASLPATARSPMIGSATSSSRVASVIDGSHVEDVPIRSWKLYQTDEVGYPVAAIHGLRDMLPRLDPTGRAMRPRESNTE
jgi:hypothetical protein